MDRSQPQRVRDSFRTAAGDHVEAAARGDSFSANLSPDYPRRPADGSIQPEGTNITSVSLA